MSTVDVDNFNGDRGYIRDEEYYCYKVGSGRFFVEGHAVNLADNPDDFSNFKVYGLESENVEGHSARAIVVRGEEVIERVRIVVLEQLADSTLD